MMGLLYLRFPVKTDNCIYCGSGLIFPLRASSPMKTISTKNSFSFSNLLILADFPAENISRVNRGSKGKLPLSIDRGDQLVALS